MKKRCIKVNHELIPVTEEVYKAANQMKEKERYRARRDGKCGQPDYTVLYEYAPYNLNEEQYRNPDQIFDGVITISKAALVEPEIHEKIKKWPSGRKQLIVKRIPRDVDYDACFKAGLICIENSRFCWHILSGGYGYIAMHLLFCIFRDYQEHGELPENIGYYV